MTTIIEKLNEQNLIDPPLFVVNQLQYMVMMGSEAYGVSSNNSDIDIYGFCIPNKNIIFPYLDGEIIGFGKQKKMFNNWQQHHIKYNNKEYDFDVYNIVRYFQLCMDNNPNMIDSLFVPKRCVLFCSKIGQHVRDNRHHFLHKGSYYKFRGYAFSQLNKINNKLSKQYIDICKKNDIPVDLPKILTDDQFDDVIKKLHYDSIAIKNFKDIHNKIWVSGKSTSRLKLIDKFGYDVKFAYHVFRLVEEAKQILTECDLDLERSREGMKSIRNGEWSIERLQNYFDTEERSLAKIYDESKLRKFPDENFLKKLLLECLEIHFGSLDNAYQNGNVNEKNLLNDLQNLVRKYKY